MKVECAMQEKDGVEFTLTFVPYSMSKVLMKLRNGCQNDVYLNFESVIFHSLMSCLK